jgi:hypothetical protein
MLGLVQTSQVIVHIRVSLKKTPTPIQLEMTAAYVNKDNVRRFCFVAFFVFGRFWARFTAWRHFVVFLSPTGKCWNNTLKGAKTVFLPRPSYFIIQSHHPFQWQVNTAVEKTSLNKLRCKQHGCLRRLFMVNWKGLGSVSKHCAYSHMEGRKETKKSQEVIKTKFDAFRKITTSCMSVRPLARTPIVLDWSLSNSL